VALEVHANSTLPSQGSGRRTLTVVDNSVFVVGGALAAAAAARAPVAAAILVNGSGFDNITLDGNFAVVVAVASSTTAAVVSGVVMHVLLHSNSAITLVNNVADLSVMAGACQGISFMISASQASAQIKHLSLSLRDNTVLISSTQHDLHPAGSLNSTYTDAFPTACVFVRHVRAGSLALATLVDGMTCHVTAVYGSSGGNLGACEVSAIHGGDASGDMLDGGVTSNVSLAVTDLSADIRLLALPNGTSPPAYVEVAAIACPSAEQVTCRLNRSTISVAVDSMYNGTMAVALRIPGPTFISKTLFAFSSVDIINTSVQIEAPTAVLMRDTSTSTSQKIGTTAQPCFWYASDLVVKLIGAAGSPIFLGTSTSLLRAATLRIRRSVIELVVARSLTGLVEFSEPFAGSFDATELNVTINAQAVKTSTCATATGIFASRLSESGTVTFANSVFRFGCSNASAIGGLFTVGPSGEAASSAPPPSLTVQNVTVTMMSAVAPTVPNLRTPALLSLFPPVSPATRGVAVDFDRVRVDVPAGFGALGLVSTVDNTAPKIVNTWVPRPLRLHCVAINSHLVELSDAVAAATRISGTPTPTSSASSLVNVPLCADPCLEPLHLCSNSESMTTTASESVSLSLASSVTEAQDSRTESLSFRALRYAVSPKSLPIAALFGSTGGPTTFTVNVDTTASDERVATDLGICSAALIAVGPPQPKHAALASVTSRRVLAVTDANAFAAAVAIRLTELRFRATRRSSSTAIDFEMSPFLNSTAMQALRGGATENDLRAGVDTFDHSLSDEALVLATVVAWHLRPAPSCFLFTSGLALDARIDVSMVDNATTFTLQGTPPREPPTVPTAIAAAGVSAAITSGLAGGSAAGAAVVARTTLIASLSNCESILGDPLDPTANPTTVALGGLGKAGYVGGAALMNTVLLVAITAVLLAGGIYVQRSLKRRFAKRQARRDARRSGHATRQVSKIDSASSSEVDGDSETTNILKAPKEGYKAAATLARMPSLLIFPLMFLLQPTSSSAIVLLVFSDGQLGAIALGVVTLGWIIGVLAWPTWLFSRSNFRAVWVPRSEQQHEERLKGSSVVTALVKTCVLRISEPGRWYDEARSLDSAQNDADDLGAALLQLPQKGAAPAPVAVVGAKLPPDQSFVRGHLLFFADYNGRCRWFILVELVFTVLLSIADAVTMGGACAGVAVFVIVAYVAYIALLLVKRPHESWINFACTVGVAVLQLAATIVALVMVVFGATDAREVLLQVLLMAALAATTLRGVYDVARNIVRLLRHRAVKSLEVRRAAKLRAARRQQRREAELARRRREVAAEERETSVELQGPRSPQATDAPAPLVAQHAPATRTATAPSPRPSTATKPTLSERSAAARARFADLAAQLEFALEREAALADAEAELARTLIRHRHQIGAPRSAGGNAVAPGIAPSSAPGLPVRSGHGGRELRDDELLGFTSVAPDPPRARGRVPPQRIADGASEGLGPAQHASSRVAIDPSEL
jgi:hypothetical protein